MADIPRRFPFPTQHKSAYAEDTTFLQRGQDVRPALRGSPCCRPNGVRAFMRVGYHARRSDQFHSSNAGA